MWSCCIFFGLYDYVMWNIMWYMCYLVESEDVKCSTIKMLMWSNIDANVVVLPQVRL